MEKVERTGYAGVVVPHRDVPSYMYLSQQCERDLNDLLATLKSNFNGELLISELGAQFSKAHHRTGVWKKMHMNLTPFLELFPGMFSVELNHEDNQLYCIARASPEMGDVKQTLSEMGVRDKHFDKRSHDIAGRLPAHLTLEPAELPYNYKYYYCDNLDKCDELIHAHFCVMRRGHLDWKYSAIGFDIECRPKDRLPALVQISSLYSCLLIHIVRMRELPTLLLQIMQASAVRKVGVNATNDAELLQQYYPQLQCSNVVDVDNIATRENGHTALKYSQQQKVGLQELAACYLHLQVNKQFRVTVSDWASDLSEEQKLYAAIDAYISLRLYNVICGTARRNVEDPHGNTRLRLCISLSISEKNTIPVYRSYFLSYGFKAVGEVVDKLERTVRLVFEDVLCPELGISATSRRALINKGIAAEIRKRLTAASSSGGGGGSGGSMQPHH